MLSIDHTIEISAAPAAVLAALTTKAGLRGWFTDDVRCDRARNEVTLAFCKPVGTMEFTLRLDEASERAVVMTVVAEREAPDWRETRIAYELAATPAGTRVRLVHSGFRAKTEHYDMTTKGWAMFLASLQQYVETGKGDPHVPQKTIVQRWEHEFKNEANVDITDELMSADFVHQLPLPGLPPGREGLKVAGRGIFAAFAHDTLKVTIEQCLHDGERVITRTRVSAKHTGDFNGIPATGKQVGWTETTLYRVKDGKIVEMIGEGNFLGLVAQLTAK